MATRHSLERFFVPESSGADAVVLSAKHHNELIRELIACLPVPGVGIRSQKTAGGTIISSGDGGSAAAPDDTRIPFLIMDDGAHYADGDTNHDHPIPKILTVSGYVVAAGAGSAITQVPFGDDGHYTWNQTDAYIYVWVDVQSHDIHFENDWPDESAVVPNKAKSFRLGRVHFVAEAGDVKAHIGEIVQYWQGDIYLGDQIDHTHSTPGDGGNQLDIKVGIDDAHTVPSIKIAGVEHILFDDGGDIKGLGAEYAKDAS